MTTIKVSAYNNWWGSDPVTVRTYQDEMLVYCNHANSHGEDSIVEIPRQNQPDVVYTQQTELCDKCSAWRPLSDSEDGEWYNE